ncbi:MAG: type II toxin-antitoxin system HicB family antitoxin [Chloroflexi bacterium]|nr:type II toxin-antitoxin system HicB family antitoxin [Chloroflexota bacterium]
MKLYKLPVVLYEPSEDTGNKYLAGVPALPGCRAWGDSAVQALEYVQSVATAFLESYRERGDPLPPEVETRAQDVPGPSVVAEVLLAS